jgi:hypothetical protein
LATEVYRDGFQTNQIHHFRQVVIRSFDWPARIASITLISIQLLKERDMKDEKAGAPSAQISNSRTTEDLLIQSHGILLNLQQCAALLNRKSAESLRVAISGNSELGRLLAPAKIKIGRRVLFKASVLAHILDNAPLAR